MSGLSLIDKLNDENYDEWSFKIKMHLMNENLWNTVSQPPPTLLYYDNWDEKNNRAMAIIGLSVADNQLKHIKNLKSAYDYWIKLQAIYEESISNRKISLTRKLLKMNLNNQTMEQHLSNMMEIIGKLLSYGDGFTENFLITKILSTLPHQYDSLIESFESVSETNLTIEYVNQKLLLEYKAIEENKKNSRMGKNKNKENNQESAKKKNQSKNIENSSIDLPPSYQDVINKNDNRGNSIASPSGNNLFLPEQCNYCKQLGHQISECRTRMRNENVGASVPPQCFYCKQPGHQISECRTRMRNANVGATGPPQCFYCKQPGHQISECRARMRKENVGATVPSECFYCKQPGHQITECRARMRKENVGATVPPECFYCKQPGHQITECRARMRKENVGATVPPECFYCKQPGHQITECRARMRKENVGATVPPQCLYCKQPGHQISECQIRMRKESEDAFQIINHPPVQCTYCNKVDHTYENCHALAKVLEPAPSAVCTYCGEIGHTKNECERRNSKRKEGECSVS